MHSSRGRVKGRQLEQSDSAGLASVVGPRAVRRRSSAGGASIAMPAGAGFPPVRLQARVPDGQIHPSVEAPRLMHPSFLLATRSVYPGRPDGGSGPASPSFRNHATPRVLCPAGAMPSSRIFAPTTRSVPLGDSPPLPGSSPVIPRVPSPVRRGEAWVPCPVLPQAQRPSPTMERVGSPRLPALVSAG